MSVVLTQMCGHAIQARSISQEITVKTHYSHTSRKYKVKRNCKYNIVMETLFLTYSNWTDYKKKNHSTSDEMTHKNIILLFLLQLVSGNSHQWAGHLHAGYSTKNMTLDRNLSVEHEFLCLDGCFFLSLTPSPFCTLWITKKIITIIKKF